MSDLQNTDTETVYVFFEWNLSFWVGVVLFRFHHKYIYCEIWVVLKDCSDPYCGVDLVKVCTSKIKIVKVQFATNKQTIV